MAQVDFGQGAIVLDESGRRRRPHLLRVVLSHSRKGYTEAINKQTTENFLRCLESAFWHFGGVPKTLIIDNLRAAVSKADWFDPELNPKIQSFAAQTLDQFDFSFNSSLPKRRIMDLATGRFIREAADVLLLGPPGTGKSHCCQAVGRSAIKAGFSVLYRSIFDVVRDFLQLF